MRGAPVPSSGSPRDSEPESSSCLQTGNKARHGHHRVWGQDQVHVMSEETSSLMVTSDNECVVSDTFCIGTTH